MTLVSPCCVCFFVFCSAAIGPAALANLYRQCWFDVGLCGVAAAVRAEKDNSKRNGALLRALQSSPAMQLALGASDGRSRPLVLPSDAYVAVRGAVLERCRWLQSFTVPLWLELQGGTLSPSAPGAMRQLLIYKAGDDLRQDALTLLVLGCMNRVWQAEGLDMRMTLYDVLPTGSARGFIEVVRNTKTTAELQQAAGGVAAVFRRNVISDWLKAKVIFLSFFVFFFFSFFFFFRSISFLFGGIFTIFVLCFDIVIESISDATQARGRQLYAFMCGVCCGNVCNWNSGSTQRQHYDCVVGTLVAHRFCSLFGQCDEVWVNPQTIC